MIEPIRFRWVGISRDTNEVIIDGNLTTKRVMDQENSDFFSLKNRRKGGKCTFIAEDLCSPRKDIHGKYVYANDILPEGKIRYHKGSWTVGDGIPLRNIKALDVIGNIWRKVK